MEELSERQIECLVGLVEDQLVALSRAGEDRGADYRALQDCRRTLLAKAGALRRSATLAGLRRHPQPRPAPRQPAHLKAIDGGKA